MVFSNTVASKTKIRIEWSCIEFLKNRRAGKQRLGRIIFKLTNIFYLFIYLFIYQFKEIFIKIVDNKNLNSLFTVKKYWLEIKDIKKWRKY